MAPDAGHLIHVSWRGTAFIMLLTILSSIDDNTRQDKHLGRWAGGGGVPFFFAAFVSESFFNHEHEYKMPPCKKLQVLICFFFFLVAE